MWDILGLNVIYRFQKLLNSEQRNEALRLLDRIKSELVDERFKLIEVHKLDGDQDLTRKFSKCLITDLIAAIGSDGNLYPCNYHPRPEGHVYGNVTDTPFKTVWEGTRRRDMKKKIPEICPSMCDPFKNRANRLLNVVQEVFEEEGYSALDMYRNDLGIYP